MNSPTKCRRGPLPLLFQAKPSIKYGWATTVFTLLFTAAIPWRGVSGENPKVLFPPFVMPHTELRNIPRSGNGRDYLLYVALPASYERGSSKRYPVLYICDGQYDFPLVDSSYWNLRYDNAVPELIIVGFGYQSHMDDYNPSRAYDYLAMPDTHIDSDPSKTGHASEFLNVIEKEFIPFIEKNYDVDSRCRVLGGSSAGGHFVLYTMLTKPELFQAYIAISPATFLANDWLFKKEEQFYGSKKVLSARLYLTGASEEWLWYQQSEKRFEEQISSRNYLHFVTQWRLIDGEGHAGSKAEGFSRGIRFAFAPIAPPKTDE
jgi:predicted alpha/beta superfamily hydrolase